jgi:hypothetical protein
MSIARAARAPDRRRRFAFRICSRSCSRADPRASTRTTCRLALALIAILNGGCTRASASALLPSISLGLLARRTAQWIATDGAASERWHALALVALQFRPRSAAADLPVRAELAPETWIAPCDADDFICLQEAADAEQELRDAFGPLQ